MINRSLLAALETNADEDPRQGGAIPGRSPAAIAEPQIPICPCHSPAFAQLNALLTRKFSRHPSWPTDAGAFGSDGLSPPVPEAPATPVAFVNVSLFDGKSDGLVPGKRVVVEHDRIKAVEDARKPVAQGIAVIDGGGRTLMPGLIDAHWHTMMAAISEIELMASDAGYINLVAAAEARRTLMRGFTSIRDMAGPSFGLKRAIDDGLTPGPRIWPSGAMISQTGGHGDFRVSYHDPVERNAPLSRPEALGFGLLADGVDQVLLRVREQLMHGANQIKLAAGGGVISRFDPIDVSQFTEAEFRAAVDAAENWGTYVAVHAYTPRAIQTAIRGGVRSIEHGQLMDEETARIMADGDIWLSAQPFVRNDGPAPKGLDMTKAAEVMRGTDTAYGFAKKYGIRTAWGTDILFDAGRTATQGAMLAALKRWYAPVDILKMATTVNAGLLAMSGPRNPYPGKVGVIETDAYADLLLIDGDPLADIDLIADPEENLKVIMKDGRFYRNEMTA